jgi:cytoskeletal protein CcmA (bactofilin family)
MNLLNPAKLLLGLLAAILLLSSTAKGFLFRQQDEIYLSGDYKEDVYLLGGTVNFDGNIVSDLFMAAGTATFNGTADGNVYTAARHATVNGQVERSYHGFAQYITINALIDGDATAFGQELTLSNESHIGRDAALFAAVTFLNGTIDRDAYINSDDVNVTGRIDGNVRIRGDRITIAPSAYIGGNLEYTSKQKAEISSEARIVGETKWKKVTSATSTHSPVGTNPPPTGFWTSLIFLVGSIIVGIVLLATKRNGVIAIADEIKSNWLVDGLLGLALIIVAPIVLFLLAITVIGLPLALVGFSAYGITFWAGKILTGIAIGAGLLSLTKREGRPSFGWSLVIGMIILALLFKIPYFSWLIYVLAWSVGAGALAVVFFRRYRNGRTSSPTATASAGQAEASA